MSQGRTWIQRQLARIRISHAIVDQEAMDVSFLVVVYRTGNLVTSVAH